MRKVICLAILLAVSTVSVASARIVTDVPVPGGFLEVEAIVGTGSSTAYVTIDFSGAASVSGPGIPAMPNIDTDMRDREGSYAFGVRFDDPGSAPFLTIGDALETIAASLDGSGSDEQSFSFAATGSATTGFGRFVDGFTYSFKDGGSTVKEQFEFASGSFGGFWNAALLDPGALVQNSLQTGVDSVDSRDPSGTGFAQLPANLTREHNLGTTHQVSDVNELDGLLDDGDVFGLTTHFFFQDDQNQLIGITPDAVLPAASNAAIGAPEPSSLVLLVFALATLTCRRTRRKATTT